jgi:hypothetical protein
MTNEKKPAGLPPEGYVRFTANLKKDIHMRLKLYSVRSGKPMSEILEEWVERYTADL